MRSVWPKSGELRVFKSDNGSRWTPNQQDKHLADTTSSDVLWSLTDYLGTVRDVLGTTTTHLIYDAFGNLISGTNPLLFGYTGKAFDVSTNLQNNINRWYDSTIGRWLSTDPIEFSAGDSNLYRYIKNRCILECDYLGFSGLWDWITDSATFVDQRAGQVAVFLVTLDWIDADTASFSEFVCDTSCGLVQGGANTVNGVQDGAVGLTNLGIIGARYMGADWEYFQSPDWSRNLIVSEPGIPGTWSDAHGWGKFIGGESLTFLLTQGLSGIRWGEKGRTLIHYTTTDGAMGIRQSQKIMGKGGIFAVDSSIQNPPFFLWKLRNTPKIKIPIEGVIASKFQPVPVVGLISFMAKTKNSYVIYANSIDLANGCIKNFDGWVPIIQINGPIFFDATAGQLLWTTPQVLQGTLFPSETGMDVYKK